MAPLQSRKNLKGALMGIRSTRPLPLAHAELTLAPFFKRRFRSWHLEHVRLVLQRYRLLTSRFCVDALQLSAILGIKEKKLVDDVMRLFLPRTPTRVQCMVDVMEVLIALVLVCQAPGMLQRFELIFDIVDLEAKGAISTTDLIMLCGAAGRAIMKLFEYKVEPEQHAAMTYVSDVLDSLGVNRNGSIAKEVLCKFMVSDHFAVHYAKQCTGEEKPKLYIMMEKDAEFLGTVEFSNDEHMQTAPLRTVRDMIYAQVHRVPDDFLFLCQGREVEKVWEVDRRAWSIVPFALRGSPGLRTDIMARNRQLERPAVASPFEFRYMGNLIRRYKKLVHDIEPVYKHHAFRLRKNAPRKRLEPFVEWRVATTWSGEWIYEQGLTKAKSKAEILKYLRTAARPQHGVPMVKSHFGEILSPPSLANVHVGDDNDAGDRSLPAQIEDSPLIPSKPEQRMQRITAMNLCERKHEDKLRKQTAQWKARLISMEAQNQIEKAISKTTSHTVEKKHASDGATTFRMKTVLVHVEEDITLPSRLVPCELKKRRRPKKVEWATYKWDTHERVLSTLPPSRKKLKLSKITDDISLTTPTATSTNREVGLGKYLSSTHIFLEDNHVEVFPVLVIRPVEEQVCVNERVDDVCDEVVVSSTASVSCVMTEKSRKKLFFVSKTYLTEFEYDISATESNFEALYQHIASGTLQDAIWLNRRDVCGRTMLHDAAEFGHSNVMELLLKVRVFVNTKDNRGDTPLHHAARHGHLKEVSILLREHAIPWLLNSEGKSPLYIALETAARSVSRSGRSGTETAMDLKPASANKNFFLAHHSYPQLRQVIDLLWDNYKLDHLVNYDCYDRTNCLELEKHVYGDMIQACHDGNLLRVQRLVDLEKRPVLHYINDQMEILQRTALHEATEQGHTATLDLLLKLGADGYLRDQRLQTPLHLAAYKGYYNIVRCLISKFPQSASYQDVSGSTPLHLAIQRKHWNIAIALISSCVNTKYHGAIGTLYSEDQRVRCLDFQDIHGYTALHYACIHGNLEVCTSLVNAGVTVSVSRCEYRIVTGTSHLLGMWWKGNSKNVGNQKRLIEASEQLKYIDIEAPAELLIKGCKHNLSNLQDRLAVLELLLHRECVEEFDSDCPSLVKVTPPPLFHIAAELADINISVAVEICRRLHKLQVEINMIHSQTNETVLLQECKRICISYSNTTTSDTDEPTSQLALVRTLLELGANIDLANEINGESPFGCAAWYGHLALMDLLLEAGVDKDGFHRRCSFSPLHFAALANNVLCAKMLIARSATVNVEIPPTNAETPLYFAIRSKSEEMVDLLLRSNADPCSLCTVQQDRKTSYGIVLLLPSRGHNNQANGGDNGEHECVGNGALVVSTLTFGLLVAQSVNAFAVPEELNCTVKRSRKQSEWIEMEHICLMLAKKLLQDNDGSRGVVTREDVHRASALGFWGLVQMLLSQQIALSNAPSAFGMNALHLAAAAGQTDVVTALVAGGMNVNCITRGDTIKPKRKTGRRTWYEWIGCGNRGALFYALIHGHTKTAAKLLVLGAHPDQTIPYTRKRVRWRVGKVCSTDKAFWELFVVRFIVSEAMIKASRTDQLEKGAFSNRQSENGYGGTLQVDVASVNLIYFIQSSINHGVPLLHLVVALGHLSIVRVLVEAGMSIFNGFVAPLIAQTAMAGLNAPAETPLHIAIACGHLEIVKYFASLVQNHFPGCFIREGRVFKSLLVTACETHQARILPFLVCYDESDNGGGFSYETCKDEFQSALGACALVQFVEGFQLLIQHGAKPNIYTLVDTLKGITVSSKNLMASPRVNKIEQLEIDKNDSRAAFPGERYQHDYRRNSVDVATKLLKLILSPEYVDDMSRFVGSSPVFELMLKILIICSRYRLWFVLDTIFIHHQDYFVDAASIWKPVLVRAASNSLVLHRAAMDNQAHLIAFFLRLGVVPVNLPKDSSIMCPVWYAASRGSLEAFLCLALHSTSFDRDLEFCQKLNIAFRSIEESRGILSTSNTTCRWQNLSVFGCIDVPKRHTNGYLIQKFINYGLMISRGHVDSSLLHHACRRGELIAVQALVGAGADLAATNKKGETPLEVASGRKDAFGLAIVRYLLSSITQLKHSSATDIISRSLVRCFASETSCNLKIAQALFDAGASAQFSCDINVDEAQSCGSTPLSALFYAMHAAQFSAVKMLLDHGAIITVDHTEAFLGSFLMKTEHLLQHRWRKFSKYMKHIGGQELLLDVDGIMNTLLEKKVFSTAMNPDLVHQMLTSASAIAATIAQGVQLKKRFWGVVTRILDEYPKEASNRKAEWNQKTALHYAVTSLELPTVIKLLELRQFDLLAEDENKQTSLHLAAKCGDDNVCRLLLGELQSNTTKATAIDVPDIRGRTALHLAIIHGHEAAANMLLAAGASLDVRCRNDLTALLYAAKCNRLAILIALYSQAQPKPHDALFTTNGEAGIFVAARHGAFPLVRWFTNLYEDESKGDKHDTSNKITSQGKGLLFGMLCSLGRSVLHYSAIYGDEEILEVLLKTKVTHDTGNDNASDAVNMRDNFGYTPLMYAFAFGRLRAVRMLCELGADPYNIVDHSGDPGSHPYTVGFDIAGLLQWFALPGWYSFACKHLPSEEKTRLVRDTTIDEDYLWNSSFNYRKKRRRPVEWRFKWKRIPATRCLRSEPRHRGKELVRTSIRSWRFPRKSIFDYACEIGNAQVANFLVNLHLPQLFRSLSYQAQRRNFMQAVRWNRLEIVKTLIASARPGNTVIEPTIGNHFLDFVETGVECAVLRGLESMAVYLVNQWQGIKENDRESATPSTFAFQFASDFQVACIRRLPRLMERMIERGGEEIVEFHLNEGPALVYAFAFGNMEIVNLLLRNGADPGIPTATYSVASVRKWVEFGSPKAVRVSWQPRIAEEESYAKRPAFVGPLDTYETSTRRLPIDELCQMFADTRFSISNPAGTDENNTSDEQTPIKCDDSTQNEAGGSSNDTNTNVPEHCNDAPLVVKAVHDGNAPDETAETRQESVGRIGGNTEGSLPKEKADSTE